MLPKHFHFTIIPLTVDHGKSRVENRLVWTVASYYSATLKFSELFGTTRSFTKTFLKIDCCAVAMGLKTSTSKTKSWDPILVHIVLIGLPL